MNSVNMVVGAGQIERVVENADDLLRAYRNDTGCFYLDYEPSTPNNILVPEDIAVTLLVNSQAKLHAFRSIQIYGNMVDLSSLPDKSLELTSKEEREEIAILLARIAQWPGFAVSVTTKILHKKRPNLIPILDNQSIFGAYMNQKWPQKDATGYSIKDKKSINRALDCIAFDITRAENSALWDKLLLIEPKRTRIQLFDSVWWMYFRSKQPFIRKNGSGVTLATKPIE